MSTHTAHLTTALRALLHAIEYAQGWQEGDDADVVRTAITDARLVLVSARGPA